MNKISSVILAVALLACALSASSCSSPIQAKVGDTVSVLYTGTLDDGEIFDSSELHGGEPLEFTIGAGQMIPGFEQAAIGMSVGESKTVLIAAADAYGPYHEELVIVVDWDQFPEGFEVEVGDQLQMQQADGQIVIVTVLEVSESGVTVDANHPLAGKDLTFEIQLVEIK